MSDYITHLDVSLNTDEAQNLQAQRFRKVDEDLNKGCGGNFVFIWYKKGRSEAPITRLQFSFCEEMANGLISAGYTKVHKDLNAGAKGDYIFLWYLRGTTEYDVPIVDIDVTLDANSEAGKFRSGWERLACDLNRNASGNFVHAWVRRQAPTFVCDVAATNSFGLDSELFRNGFIRLDEDTNRGANGAFVFVWYRLSQDPQRAISDVQVSTNDSESQSLRQRCYQLVDVDLNQGTGGSRVFVWYKRDASSAPVKAITLLFDADAVQAFKRAGLTVVRGDLNTANKGWSEFLSVWK